jgi:hypothetical protein
MYWVLIGLAALSAVLGYAACYFAMFPPEDEHKRFGVGLFLPLCFFLLALLSVVLAKVVRALDALVGKFLPSGEERDEAPGQDSVRPPA